MSVTRSGGFAGLREHGAADTAVLPPRKAQLLRKHLAEAALDRLPEAAGTPDAFVYEIVVEDDQGERKHYRASDDSLSDGARTLIDWLLKG